MADPDAKKVVLAAIDEMADDMKATWDSALNWASTVDALAELIVDIGGTVTPDQFTALISTAAMARRQALVAPIEAETVTLDGARLVLMREGVRHG